MMQPYYFVVQNSTCRAEGGVFPENGQPTYGSHRAFEALPGQQCGEGVTVALPRGYCDEMALQSREAQYTATFETAVDDHEDKESTELPLAAVQLRTDAHGSLILCFSDGTDTSICCSGGSNVWGGVGENNEVKCAPLRIARNAYPHLQHFCRLTKQSLPSNSGEDEEVVPSSPDYVNIEPKYVDSINKMSVPIESVVSLELVRHARTEDGISYSTILQLIRKVQDAIPLLRRSGGTRTRDDHKLNVQQFLAFSCLLENSVAEIRDAPPRLAARVLDVTHSSVRLVLSSNKPARIVVTAKPLSMKSDGDDGAPAFIKQNFTCKRNKKESITVGGLESDTEYTLRIFGLCPMSRNDSQENLVINTRSKAELLFPKWHDLNEEAQRTELIAATKDRKVRSLAAKNGISVPNGDGEMDLSSAFVSWWSSDSESGSAREEFCLREAKHASRDPITRAAAVDDGIDSVGDGDWDSTDVSKLRRWKRFCWWYYDMKPEPVGRCPSSGREIQSASSIAPTESVSITGASLDFPLPLPSNDTMNPPLKSAPTLPKGALAYSKDSTSIRKKDCNMQGGRNLSVTNHTPLQASGDVEEITPPYHDIEEEDELPQSSMTDRDDNDDRTLQTESHNTSLTSVAVADSAENKDEAYNSASANLRSKPDNSRDTSEGHKRDSPRDDDSNADATPDDDMRTKGEDQVATVAKRPSSAQGANRRPANRRSMFLVRRTTKVNTAVGRVDDMLSFTKNAKNLRGLALLKAKVRVMMITARLQALREKSGCDQEATAQEIADVDLFDDFDEKTFDPGAPSTAAPSAAAASEKPPNVHVPVKTRREKEEAVPATSSPKQLVNPATPPVCEKKKEIRSPDDEARVIASIGNVHNKVSTRLMQRAYGSWERWVEEQKAAAGEATMAADDVFDENMAAATAEEESSSDDGVKSSASVPVGALDSKSSSKEEDKDNSDQAIPSPAIEVNPADDTHFIAKEYLLFGVEDQRSSRCRDDHKKLSEPPPCNHAEIDLDNLPFLLSSMIDKQELRRVMQLLPELGYPNGSGAHISDYEYETEYKAYFERRAPPPDPRAGLFGN